jgi:hypothetical protein
VNSSHRAAGGLLVLLAVAGCAGPRSVQPQSELGRTLLAAYEHSVSVQGVAASVQETLRSGTEPVAEGTGSMALWFAEHAGQTRLTMEDSSTTVTAIRVNDRFYQGDTRSDPAKNAQDLVSVGRQDPSRLPQIRTPGLDPFQLTTLLDAVQWPDAIPTLGPVAVADSVGVHTDYQIVVDTAKLAQHAPAADAPWLRAMSREPEGAEITLDVGIVGGRIASLSGQLPVLTPPVAADLHKPATATATPQPMNIVVAETFSYQQSPAKVSAPT